MRVVEWHEFSKLPVGTIYSKREAKKSGDAWSLWEGLYIKGKTRGMSDHYEASLIPTECGVGNEDAVLDISLSCSAFEGEFPHHYAIFEGDDLNALERVVVTAAKLTDCMV